MLKFQLSRPRAGFTLIELLVVVVIIGILASIAVGGFNAAMDRARNGGVTSNVRTVMMGVEQWKTDHQGLPEELTGDDHTKGVASNKADASGDFPVKYTPGGRLPTSPWARANQIAFETGFDASIGNTLPGDDEILSGGAGSALQDNGSLDIADTGPAKGSFDDTSNNVGLPPPPGSPPSIRRHYGYIYYVGDRNTARYIILGIGKIKEKALATAVRSNFQ